MIKQVVILLFAFAVSAGCFGQKKEVVEYEKLWCGVVEAPAAFPGGDQAFRRFFQRQFQYPDSAAQSGIGGSISFSFIIAKDGTVTEPQVTRGLGFGMDAEVIRILLKSPKWTPGQRNGRVISWRVTQRFTFCPGDDQNTPTTKEHLVVGEGLIS